MLENFVEDLKYLKSLFVIGCVMTWDSFKNLFGSR